MHRNRLDAGEDVATSEREHQGQDHAHHRIEVLDRVEREAAEHERRLVALPERGIAVGVLVGDDREEQDRQLEQETLKTELVHRWIAEGGYGCDRSRPLPGARTPGKTARAMKGVR